jgi:NTP pyrophosphatase (non-canonical NTP hydrolase)
VSNDDKRYGACGSLCQGPHAYGIVSATHGGWCDGPAPVPPVADEPTDLTSRVMMTQADAVSLVADERAGHVEVKVPTHDGRTVVYEVQRERAAVPVEAEAPSDDLLRAISRALFMEVNGGELEPVWQLYKPEGVALVLRQRLIESGVVRSSVSSDDRNLRAKVEAKRSEWATEDSLYPSTEAATWQRAMEWVLALLAGETEPGPSFNLTAWQAEVWAMTQELFPHRADPRSRALKFAEEAGEVVGAVVKHDEGRMSLDDIESEIADATIVLASLCGSLGLDYAAVLRRWWSMALTKQRERLAAGETEQADEGAES